MKRYLPAVAAFTLALPSLVVADDEPLSIKGATTEQMQLMLVGAAESLMAYNMLFVAKGIDRRLIRVPLEGKPVTGQEMLTLASRVLTGPHELGAVITAAVSELAEKYPCPRVDR